MASAIEVSGKPGGPPVVLRAVAVSARVSGPLAAVLYVLDVAPASDGRGGSIEAQISLTISPRRALAAFATDIYGKLVSGVPVPQNVAQVSSFILRTFPPFYCSCFCPFC
jgi:hypothetical protein